jgi:G3E family GTPase
MQSLEPWPSLFSSDLPAHHSLSARVLAWTVLVEASGSALPGPLVWEIAKASEIVRVDGVVTVVDCANFARLNNFSRTAKIQVAA